MNCRSPDPFCPHRQGWLVRDGKTNVDASLRREGTFSLQTTGGKVKFTKVLSARTAVGFDAEGRLPVGSKSGVALRQLQ